jgi:hypothetical protein
MSKVAFFITGTGRSGTKWLAALLNESKGVRVYHEPLMREAKTLTEGHLASTAEAVEFLRERKRRMVTRDGQDWGEVNHYLRHWVEPLRTVFPSVPIVGLIRDGRDTVNSLVHRGLYARRDRRVLPIPPEKATDQFAKCCWFWADTYERLYDQGVPIVTLGRLNKSYRTYWLLCERLAIKPVSQRVWRTYAGRRIHSSRMPVSGEWTPEQEAVFEEWAGNTQREL